MFQRSEHSNHTLCAPADGGAETPCRNCSSAGTSCIYPVRDRNVFISENYLSNLQAQIEADTQSRLSSTQHPSIDNNQRPPVQGPDPGAYGKRYTGVPVIKNATAEAFVSGLKKLRGTDPTGSPTVPAPFNNIWTISGSDAQDDDSQHDYVPLDFDISCTDSTLHAAHGLSRANGW